MKKALVLVATMVFATMAYGQTGECDLDGVFGNGPDVVSAEVSDYIAVNLMIQHPTMLFSWGITFSNPDGSLEFQGCEYFVPAVWTAVPCQPGDPVTAQATDFTFTAPLDVSVPTTVCVVTFHAAVDCSMDEIIVLESGWLDVNFISGVFDPFTPCTVVIGGTGTEESSWGAVKDLFR